jgi:hypothetical protein
VVEAFEDRAHDDGPGDRGIDMDFDVSSSLALGYEFPPRNTLGIATAREPPPMFGLWADSNGVAIATDGFVEAESVGTDLEIGAHLLSPICNSSAGFGLQGLLG